MGGALGADQRGIMGIQGRTEASAQDEVRELKLGVLMLLFSLEVHELLIFITFFSWTQISLII